MNLYRIVYIAVEFAIGAATFAVCYVLSEVIYVEYFGPRGEGYFGLHGVGFTNMYLLYISLFFGILLLLLFGKLVRKSTDRSGFGLRYPIRQLIDIRLIFLSLTITLLLFYVANRLFRYLLPDILMSRMGRALYVIIPFSVGATVVAVFLRRKARDKNAEKEELRREMSQSHFSC